MMLGRELDTHALQRAGENIAERQTCCRVQNYGKKRNDRAV